MKLLKRESNRFMEDTLFEEETNPSMQSYIPPPIELECFDFYMGF